MAEQLLSQKYANYNYAPGIATYGIDGKTGQSGNDGNNIYFTDYNINENDGLSDLMQKILNNYLPIKGVDTKINRAYKENDIFFDRNGIIYKLININVSLSLTEWKDYFTIVGKIHINDDEQYFDTVNNRLVLNTKYNGYDICSNVNANDASQYINTEAAVNIVSRNIDENNNIEMVRMQSIDDVDVEDGKMSVLYKTTENAFYIDSNKPIVIDGDLKVENDNNINNEYDNFSTVLTSDDPITYFKYLCDKLNYSIIYDTQKNQYVLAIYSIEDSSNAQKQTLQYIFDRNETIFGKIYVDQNEGNTNNITLIKLEKNFEDETQPYLYSYIPTNIQSITTFSLIYNTEIFLKFNAKNNIELKDFDYSKYSSIKLMRYNSFYYGMFKDINSLVPDEETYFEYTGETIWYPSETANNKQLCYIWRKHDYDNFEDIDPPYIGQPTIVDEYFALLTNSLHLSLPFDSNSPEFVALVIRDTQPYFGSDPEEFLDNHSYALSYKIDNGISVIECQTEYGKNPRNFNIPNEYKGLRILKKTI